MAPLMAIVDTTNISSHIVRSIEKPLRQMINATIECKVNEKLKEDIVSSKILGKVNKFDALQQKMDEHIGDNRNQMTEVNQDIATLRKEMEERITREILDKVNKLTRAISNVNTNQDEKMKKLANNMDGVKLELQKKIEEHMGDDRNQMTGVKQDIMSLRKEMEERILREIRDKLQNLTRNFSIEKKDLDEKVKKLTNAVDVMQSDLKETIVSVDSQ
ncbi:uncharacterized protein LOC134684054 [Mytilus trossulus]|uniref:uncharacterized protein LOC134684054 n=1 Tax=Mytilus trossulus TaxID=6551 RepID=UPI00300447DD